MRDRTAASRGTSAPVGRSVVGMAIVDSSWRSGHEAAAVHVEYGADTVAGVFGDEVAHGAGDLRQLGPALHLRPRQAGALSLRRQGVEEVLDPWPAAREARRADVHRDAERRQL